MLKAIEAYLDLRRATGFGMSNAEYLLKSFAAFAAERGQTHVCASTFHNNGSTYRTPLRHHAGLVVI
jgi:hypothetical protein